MPSEVTRDAESDHPNQNRRQSRFQSLAKRVAVLNLNTREKLSGQAPTKQNPYIHNMKKQNQKALQIDNTTLFPSSIQQRKQTKNIDVTNKSHLQRGAIRAKGLDCQVTSLRVQQKAKHGTLFGNENWLKHQPLDSPQWRRQSSLNQAFDSLFKPARVGQKVSAIQDRDQYWRYQQYGSANLSV